jgi:hypothetical protein
MQKSKLRNASGEIFAPAVAEIMRETVSTVNSMSRPFRAAFARVELIRSLLSAVQALWLAPVQETVR